MGTRARSPGTPFLRLTGDSMLPNILLHSCQQQALLYLVLALPMCGVSRMLAAPALQLTPLLLAGTMMWVSTGSIGGMLAKTIAQVSLPCYPGTSVMRYVRTL